MIAAAGLLLGCLVPALSLSTSGPASASDEKLTFTVAMTNEVDSFNPFVGIEAESFEAWALTYDYMIGYNNDDMSIAKTGLAEDWETSEDGLTWTFQIRDGVTWSDGEPLTAADIAFTYNRILDGGPERATWGSYLQQVDTIAAPDDNTVVLSMKKPNSSLPLLPIPIVPEHIWKDVSEDDVKTYKAEPENGEPVVGSGPFRFVEGSAGGSTYKFEANPDYWQGAPNIDEVVFRIYKSNDPAIQALIKGEVDFVEDITPVQVEALQDQPGITAQSGESPGFAEVSFNTGSIDLDTNKPIGDPNPAVLDPKFRHALGFAIDRDKIVDRVYQGGALPGTTIIPPAYDTYHWEPPADEAFTYDPEKAKQLLDEAGYTVGDDGYRNLPNGDPIGTLRLFARTDSPFSLPTMDFVQEWFDAVEVKSEVKAVESSNLTDIILKGDFDAFQWGWYVEPDPSSMLDYMTCDQLGNWSDSWYCNDEYDALYDQQQTEVDPEARAEIVKQMQKMVYEDAPYLVTAYEGVGEAFRSDRFACLVPQPNPGGVWLIQYGVYNYVHMKPADEAGDCGGEANATQATEAADDSSISTGLLVGIGVAAAAAAIGAGIVMLRRRRTVGDRE